MLVNELGGIVDYIVDDQEDVLLGVVLGNILVCVFCRHFDKLSEVTKPCVLVVGRCSSGRRLRGGQMLGTNQLDVDLEVNRSKK